MLDFKFTDAILVFATIAGPILAVQAQKWVERGRETRGRRLAIFHTLMATRGTRVSPDHVQALNMIELSFIGKWQSKKWQAVVDAYRVYFDRLCEKLGDSPDQATLVRWNDRCDDLFVELMFEMSNALGYDFDKVQLRRGVYHPNAFIETQLNERMLRDSLYRVLNGQQPLALKITEFPVMETTPHPGGQTQNGLAASTEHTPSPTATKPATKGFDSA